MCFCYIVGPAGECVSLGFTTVRCEVHRQISGLMIVVCCLLFVTGFVSLLFVCLFSLLALVVVFVVSFAFENQNFCFYSLPIWTWLQVNKRSESTHTGVESYNKTSAWNDSHT